jgi:hypothetical protein
MKFYIDKHKILNFALDHLYKAKGITIIID